MAILRKQFRGRVISCNGDISWPAYSPDLSICEFFLSGFLKARVYQNKPLTLVELKEAKRQEITNLTNNMLEKVTTLKDLMNVFVLV